MAKWLYIQLIALLLGTLLLSACRPSPSGETMKGGELEVATEPPGATVLLDERPGAASPAVFTQVPPGEHLVVAEKPGFREARTTVRLAEAAPRAVTTLKLEPILGLLLIHSTPADADVEIDDTFRGKTPLLLTDLPLGKYRLRLKAAGHAPRLVEVNVPDRIPQKLDVSLSSDSARLSIESVPAAAEVMLDGSVVGKTPLDMARVIGGKHVVEVALKGYNPFRQEFVLQAGEEKKIQANLSGMPAKLTVKSVPEKARIYVNDQFKGEAPLTIPLPAAEYTVKAELRGFETLVRSNVLVSVDGTAIDLALAKNSGILVLTTEPPGVTVFLDGEKAGVTTGTPSAILSDPLQLDFLTQGPHKLQLTRQGYFDLTKPIDIRANQTVIQHEPLKQRPVPFVPNVIVLTGAGEENRFSGVIRERYENGDIKLETDPGIFKTLRKKEIKSIEPIDPSAPPSSSPLSLP